MNSLYEAEAKPNARLIAAAPRLLAACGLALRHLDARKQHVIEDILAATTEAIEGKVA